MLVTLLLVLSVLAQTKSVIMPSLAPKLRIVAAGRGRSMCLPPILDAVMAMATSKNAPQQEEVNLLYLGTATYDEMDAFEAQTHAYAKLPSVNVVKLDVSERIAEADIPKSSDIQKLIHDAHIIMVSGGNTLYAVKRWKQLGMDKMIRQAVEERDPAPVLCGGSAGAIAWFQYGHSDSMDPTTFLKVDPNLTEEQKKAWEYIRVDGLGYIPNCLCVPHHDATQSNGLPRSQDSDKMLLQNPDLVCIGIEEQAALVVCAGHASVVAGDDEGKKGCVAKIVDSESKILSYPLKASRDSIPFDDLTSYGYWNRRRATS